MSQFQIDSLCEVTLTSGIAFMGVADNFMLRGLSTNTSTYQCSLDNGKSWIDYPFPFTNDGSVRFFPSDTGEYVVIFGVDNIGGGIYLGVTYDGVIWSHNYYASDYRPMTYNDGFEIIAKSGVLFGLFQKPFTGETELWEANISTWALNAQSMGIITPLNFGFVGGELYINIYDNVDYGSKLVHYNGGIFATIATMPVGAEYGKTHSGLIVSPDNQTLCFMLDGEILTYDVISNTFNFLAPFLNANVDSRISVFDGMLIRYHFDSLEAPPYLQYAAPSNTFKNTSLEFSLDGSAWFPTAFVFNKLGSLPFATGFICDEAIKFRASKLGGSVVYTSQSNEGSQFILRYATNSNRSPYDRQLITIFNQTRFLSLR